MAKKILIIEDERKISKLLKINFTSEGYEVDIAHTGEQGLDKIDSFKPDLIILDVMLPGMDGWEICKKIKSNPAYKKISVLILTASTQKADIEKSVTVKADGFLGKPFEIHFINEKIKDMIKHSCKGVK